MSSLYEITQDVMRLQRMLEDGDIDDETYEDTLESLSADDKIENICKVIKNLEHKAEAYKAEIDRMNARKKTIENSIQRLKDSMVLFLQVANKPKVDAGLFKVSLGESKSVNVWDESLLPKQFLIEQKPKVDKTAISKALKEGEKVNGADFVVKKYVTMR